MKVILEKKAAKYLAGESAIETNLTDEEKGWVQEGRKQYKEHPEDFVPLESIQ